MRKKLLVLLLTLAAMFALLTISAGAADVVDSGTCGDQITWTLDRDGVLTISGEGELETGWGAPWAEYFSDIRSVDIEPGITTIGNSAFRNCVNLTSVSMPDGITSIGQFAFSGCSSLTGITIPESMREINMEAFRNCISLTAVKIPDGVTSVRESAFGGCTNLSDISLTDTVTDIGSGAFSGTAYYNDQSHWENGVLYIGHALIKAETSITEHEIKADTNSIADYAFFNCQSLSRITIPNGMKNIGRCAFENCYSLTELVIPGNGLTIQQDAFEYCKGLTSVVLEEGVSELERDVFKGCARLENIQFPDSLTKVAGGVFYGTAYEKNPNNWENGMRYLGKTLLTADTSLTSCSIKPGTKVIAECAFSECENLQNVLIPDGVETIGVGAFSGCGALTEIVVPNSVTYIGSSAFSMCGNLKRLVLSENLSEITHYMVGVCGKLETLILPSHVTQIGSMAFAECSSLKELTIPASVSSIDTSAFWKCDSLQNIFAEDGSPYFCSLDGVLFSKDRATLVCYPVGRAGAYQIPEGTKYIEKDAFLSCGITAVQFPSTLKSIRFTAFAECEALTELVIPDNVTTFGIAAFRDCTGLQHVTLPSGIEEITNSLFSNCSSLKDITIPEGVKKIDHDAFFYCTSLKEMVIPDGVTTLGGMVLYQCSSLETVTIPNSVTEIGSHAFNGCSALREIQLPPNLKEISSELLEGCSGLTEIVIPTSVSAIANGAFAACTGITDIVIPGGVTTLGAAAFSGCSNLKTITLPAGMREIEWYAFSECGALTDIYFLGTEEQWNSVNVGRYNDPLKNATIHCGVPITITQQPVDYIGAVNSTARFTVVASGDGLSYQWQYSDDGVTWLLSSLKTATYSAKLTAEKSGRMVRCVVSDPYGSAVTSDPAVMRVSNLKLTAQPKDYVGAVNSTAKFSVGATGDGLKYQWQYSDDGGQTWLASTLKTAVYSAKLTAEKDGRMVHCIVTDQYGVSAISGSAKMTVSGPAITGQPADYVGLVNSTAKFTVVASGSGLKYQWQYSDDGGKTWLESSLRSATYSAKFTAEKNNRMVRCIITDASGSSVTSTAAKMTLSAPVITGQPKDYTGAVNSTAKFTVTASGSGLTYQWQYSDNGGKTWLASSLKSAVYSAKFTAEKNGRMVRCVVTDANGVSVTSNAASMKLG